MSTSNRRDDFGPVTRNRSSSANEASKPILVLQRRQTHVGSKPANFSPSNGSNGGKFSINSFYIRIYVNFFFKIFTFFLLIKFKHDKVVATEKKNKSNLESTQKK